MSSKVEEVTSPRSKKKNHEESATVYYEIGSSDPIKECIDNQKESMKQESSNQVIDSKEEDVIKEKVGILGSNFVANIKKKMNLLEQISDKHDKEGLSLGCNGRKQPQQLPFSKQQQKPAQVDHKHDKQALTASKPLPVPIASWPSGFPSFGYMGQVPPLQAVVPLDGGGASLATNTIQPPNFIQPQQPLKCCATHCYIS